MRTNIFTCRITHLFLWYLINTKHRAFREIPIYTSTYEYGRSGTIELRHGQVSMRLGYVRSTYVQNILCCTGVVNTGVLRRNNCGTGFILYAVSGSGGKNFPTKSFGPLRNLQYKMYSENISRLIVKFPPVAVPAPQSHLWQRSHSFLSVTKNLNIQRIPQHHVFLHATSRTRLQRSIHPGHLQTS